MSNLRKILIFLAFSVLVLPACGGSDDPTDPGNGGGDSPDTTAPRVSEFSPPDGSLGVDPLNTLFWISFSEPMDQDSLEGQVTLSHGSFEALQWMDEQQCMLIPVDLPEGTLVTVTIGTGVRDQTGNNLASAYQSTFTTTTAVPVLLEHEPAEGAVGVDRAVPIRLQFTNPMDDSSLLSGITIADDNRTTYPFTLLPTGSTNYRLDPTDDLAALVQVTVTLTTEVMDYLGTPLDSVVSFSFTTGETVDTEPPTIVAIDPPSGSTIAVDAGQITIQFSEPVDEMTLAPVTMNGQLFLLLEQVTEEVSLDATGMILTVPLPAELPAGVPLEVGLGGYADFNGNVQDVQTDWSVTVDGAVDAFHLEDGGRYVMIGEWAEGPLGSEIPSTTDEHWVFYQTEARSTAGQWEIQEYGWEYSQLEYYDILSVSSSGADLLGFAEPEGNGFTEYFISSPLTLTELPFAEGNSWSDSGTVQLPGGTLSVILTGGVVGQMDLEVGMVGDVLVTWTDVWKVTRAIDIMSGGETISAETSSFWFAPGIGLIRDQYREENYDPEENYWYEYDNWRQLEAR